MLCRTHPATWLACALLLYSTTTHALQKLPVLSLDVAQQAARACHQLALEKNWRMTVAVADAGANMLLFERMDQAYLGSSEIALNKARSSANFPLPTRVAAELSLGKDGKPGPIPGLAWTPGLVSYAGGLPILVGGLHIGAIGVSGGTPQEDEQCAQAGLDAIQRLLN